MEIINNATTLLNEIKNNSYLTINDNGEIVKQSTFKGILRKIGDFFKNNFGGGKAVTERQEKLSNAMHQMLAKSDLSYESFDGIRNSVFKSFENSELTLAATKLKAMAMLNKVDPNLREFVKGAIADIDKCLGKFGRDAYCNILNNLMHTMTKVFKDIDPKNPDIMNLNNVYKNILQQQCMQEVSKNAEYDVTSQFAKDIQRGNFNVNGKISMLQDGSRKAEGILNELKLLFPNKTTRLFVSELLSQTTGNCTGNMLMNSERGPNGFVKFLNANVPSTIVGNFYFGSSSLQEEDDEPVNPDKPIYCLTAKENDSEAGSTLTVKRDDKGNIIGATIIRDQPFVLKTIQYSSVDSFGVFYFSTKLELDLRNPDNPQIVGVDMSYGGNKQGPLFKAEEKNPK